jgi:putative ABC transport system permease protein
LSYRYLTLKLNTPDMAKAIDDIKARWKALSPTAPFVFSFMDDRFQSLYKSELQLKKTAGLATALNLVIVFLGIFGVVAFTLARREKEMAVRKVLGADIRNIILLFIQGYVWPILIANLIAWPLAYLITDRWLANYAYRISQDIAPYLFVCLIIAIMTFILIASQCFKTAVSNPVNSLRAE